MFATSLCSLILVSVITRNMYHEYANGYAVPGTTSVTTETVVSRTTETLTLTDFISVIQTVPGPTISIPGPTETSVQTISIPGPIETTVQTVSVPGPIETSVQTVSVPGPIETIISFQPTTTTEVVSITTTSLTTTVSTSVSTSTTTQFVETTLTCEFAMSKFIRLQLIADSIRYNERAY